MDNKPEITQALQYHLPKFKLSILNTTFSFICLKTLAPSLELNISSSLFKYSFNIFSTVFYQVTQISSIFFSKVKRIQFVYLLTSFKMEPFFSINVLSEKIHIPIFSNFTIFNFYNPSVSIPDIYFIFATQYIFILYS